MPETRLTSFEDLYALSQRYRAWVFRGVPDAAFQLVPKIGRQQQALTAPKRKLNERRLFSNFVREAGQFLTTKPASAWEWLALAQHHGLPTRMLDWTENPLVAAYFACAQLEYQDGAIYMLITDNVVDENDLTDSPFSITRVMRYRPHHVTRRIAAQRGLFTIHPRPTEPLQSNLKHGLRVDRVIVDAAFKGRLRWNLDQFGINTASLFPDLDGLAQQLSWRFYEADPTDTEQA